MHYVISENAENFLVFREICISHSSLKFIHIYLSEEFYFLHFSTLYVVVAMPFTTTEAADYTVGTLVESNAKSCLKFLCSNDWYLYKICLLIICDIHNFVKII